VINNYEGFVKRLSNSSPAVFKVAEWIHRGGRSVYIPSIRICPPDGDPKDYFDEGDIYVDDEVKGRIKIEVKHLPNRNFTSYQDWNFSEAIVSNKNTIRRNMGQIEAYIIVNAPMTHAMVIPCNTIKYWYEKDIYASNTKKHETFFVCPVEHVVFKKITE
jgi:hypothetical protein